jgi:hypothetical protein
MPCGANYTVRALATRPERRVHGHQERRAGPARFRHPGGSPHPGRHRALDRGADPHRLRRDPGLARARAPAHRPHAGALHLLHRHRRPQRPPGHRHPQRLRRGDHDLRGPPGGGRGGHRRGLERVAGQLRRRDLPGDPAPLQGGRLRNRGWGDGDGGGGWALRHVPQHRGQCPHLRGQQQDLLRHHPELLDQSVPPRRPDGPAPALRGSRRSHPAPQGGRGSDSQRTEPARAGRRGPPVQPGRPRAGRAALLQQRALLAGLLRHQSHDSRVLRRGRLPGPRAALPDARGRGAPGLGPQEGAPVATRRLAFAIVGTLLCLAVTTAAAARDCRDETPLPPTCA